MSVSKANVRKQSSLLTEGRYKTNLEYMIRANKK